MALASGVPYLREVDDRQVDRRGLAIVLLGLWAFDAPLFAGVGSAALVGLATIPLWGRELGRYRLARPTVLLGTFAVLAGLLLAVYQSNVRPFDARVGLVQVAIVVAALTGIGLILWARTVLPLGVIAIALGVGRLAGSALHSLGQDNMWKGGLAIPLTMIVLGLVVRRAPWIQIAALLGLAGVNIVFDTRSVAGLCVLAAFFLGLQQLRFRPPPGWVGALLVASIGAVAIWGLYTAGTSLALSGRLGAEMASRTQEQVYRAGSLIAGGRPEWIGTMGLMQNHPVGYGFGAVPMYEDVWAARQGLYTVGVGSSSGYVDNYMFGGDFRLHSSAADLWAQAGPVGLGFAVYLGGVLFAGLARQLRNQTLTALVGFLAAKGLWDLGFSPLFSSAAGIATAVGLLLVAFDGDPDPAAGATEPNSREALDGAGRRPSGVPR